jgi:hypothetical protein
MKKTCTSLLGLGLLLLTQSLLAAQAAAPAALVEEIEASGSSLQMLDFVSAGDKIDLGADGRLILGYLKSCVQEQIQGGQVVVGEQQSEVNGGQVRRSTTQCDGGQLSLAANQAVHSGAVAMRDVETDTQAKLVLHDLSPLFRLPKAGKVVIKRLDQVGERHKFQVKGPTKGAPTLDLAQEGLKLSAGATYMISAPGASLIFRLDPAASSGKAGLLGRLVPL